MLQFTLRLEEGNYAAKPRPLVARIMKLISVLCCRLENHAFPKPIIALVSCRLGNHAFRKPITIVVSFWRTNQRTTTNSVLIWWYGNEFLGSSDQRPVSRLLFWFSGIFSQRASGARVVAISVPFQLSQSSVTVFPAWSDNQYRHLKTDYSEFPANGGLFRDISNTQQQFWVTCMHVADSHV